MSVPDGEPNLLSFQAGLSLTPPVEALRALLASACERAGAAAGACLAAREQGLEPWCTWGSALPGGEWPAGLSGVIAAGAALGDEAFVAAGQAGAQGCMALPLRTEGRLVGAMVMWGAPQACSELQQMLKPFTLPAAACIGQHLALGTLHEQTERLMDLARASGDWMWETDEHARYRWISGDFERMTGLQADRCVGEPVMEEPGVDGVGDQVQPPLSLREKLQRPEPFARFASCLQTPGGPRYISRSGQPVFDAQGVFRGFRGTARDVTARKQAQQTLRERAVLQRQVAEAERSSREKSEFMSRISHELRTPLNAIVGFGQLMSMDAAEPLGPAQRGRLEGVQQAGQALLNLIDALLEVAGVGEQQQPAAPAPLLPPEEACSSEAAEPNRHVLYVEDEPLNVVLMQEIFRGQKAWTLHVARDGAEGVEMACEVKPDLALIDMNLPDFNGIEVLRRLRAVPSLRGLRCIALSADAMADQISAAREAGFDDYWTKPIDLTRLLAAIGEALRAGAVKPG